MDTRERIVEASLELFTERGFAGTTMRAIAEAAGVSVGNAYYYFDSKDHLVQAFYERSQHEHIAASRSALERGSTFGERLHGVLRARIDTMQPYSAFAAAMFRSAADPDSPLSPFSAASAPSRELATSVYAEVVARSGLRLSPALAAELPHLLWLYQMGVVLFWAYDRSDGARRTHLLVDRTAPLVARVVGLSRSRLVRRTVDDVLDLVRTLRTGG